MRLMLQVAMFGILVITSGCASITQGTDQTVTVDTDPSGAKCELSRESNIIGVVNPTPGSITIDKSKEDVSVKCDKDGYQTKATSLRSEFEGMTFGNIIFGGIIGVGVDAASGAMNEYPSQVRVNLPPEEFPTAQRRQIYFERRESEIKEEAESAIARVREECGDPTKNDKCAKAIRKIEQRRDEKLAELEADRAESTVAIDEK